MISAASKRDWDGVRGAPFGWACVLGFLAICHYARTPCPACQRRWAATRWDRQRIDGGPDRRFQNNARRCAHCGHVYEVYRR
jgi:hypothetical protein